MPLVAGLPFSGEPPRSRPQVDGVDVCGIDASAIRRIIEGPRGTLVHLRLRRSAPSQPVSPAPFRSKKQISLSLRFPFFITNGNISHEP